MQDKVSIKDQMQQCRKAAAIKGMVLLDDPFTDEGITGTTTFGRQGISDLIAAVKQKQRDFDGIIIDETNRLARNLADLLIICDIIIYHRAFVYFVGQKLDSRDPHFRELLITYGQRDEAMSRTLAYEVHRGQEGRVRDGLVPGGYCFGYDHVTVTDPTRRRRGQEVEVGRRSVISNKDAAIGLDSV